MQSRSIYQKPFVWIRISRAISYHNLSPWKANIKISNTIPIFYLYHHSTYQQFSFFTFSMSDTLVRATIISSDNFTMMHLLQTSSSLKLNHSQTKYKGFVESDFMSNVRYNDVYAIYFNKKEDYLYLYKIRFNLLRCFQSNTWCESM